MQSMAPDSLAWEPWSMSQLEESLLRRWSERTLLIAGIAVGLAGVAPLALYVWLGPADGNPIGLGLLAVVAVPISAIVTLTGIIKLVVAYFSRSAE